MQKHLAKEHNIGHAREKTQLPPNDVETICVQFFCIDDSYRPSFVHVKEEREVERDEMSSSSSVEGSSSLAMTFSHAVDEAFDSMQVKLGQGYEQSTFERLQSTIDSYANQTPF